MILSPDIIKLREGDEQSFRVMVDQHRDRVFNTALGLLQHRENAEETWINDPLNSLEGIHRAPVAADYLSYLVPINL